MLKALVRDLHIPVDLRVCPTVREHDGLALSSRNAYLGASQRDDALILWHALETGLQFYNSQTSSQSPVAILKAAQDDILRSIDQSQGRVSIEYLNIVHPETLRRLTDSDIAKGGILVGAIRLKGADRTIRLIDNVILE